MKPIDAKPVLDKLGGYISECRSSIFYKNECYLQALYLVKDMLLSAPEIAEPPNDPLTLEELREMEGEAVYCLDLKKTDDSGYGITCIKDECPYVWTHMQGGRKSAFFYLNSLGSAWLAYRRKPEEVRS